MNIPFSSVAMIMLDVVSLTLTLSVLSCVIVGRRPMSRTRLALVVLLAGSSVYIAINLLIQFIASRNPADPGIPYLLKLVVSIYALTTLTAFVLVIELAGVLGEALSVLIRAGLVLVILFQLPLWRGMLFTVFPAVPPRVQPDLDQPATIFMGVILLVYQILTCWLAYHHRRRIRDKWLAASAVVCQVGLVAVSLLPALRQVDLMIWLSGPVALMIGYSLFSGNLLIPFYTRTRQLALLGDSAHALRGCQSLEAVTAEVVGQAIHLLKASTAAVFLPTSASSLEVAAAAGYEAQGDAFRQWKMALAEQALRMGRSLRLDSAEKSARAESDDSVSADFEIEARGAALSVPLICGNEIVGVLAVAALDAAQEFSEGDQAVLELLAVQAANAIVYVRSLPQTVLGEL